MLRGVDWYVVTDVSELSIGPIFKGQELQATEALSHAREVLNGTSTRRRGHNLICCLILGVAGKKQGQRRKLSVTEARVGAEIRNYHRPNKSPKIYCSIKLGPVRSWVRQNTLGQ